MKKIYSNSFLIILFSIASIYSQTVLGQIKIKWEEFPALAQKIVFDVPEGKALLVFEGKNDFRFESDNENIVQPLKDGLIYKLFIDIEPSSGAITIQHEGAENAWINYGKLNDTGSLPALKNKEIKYFKLSITKPLGFYDVTRQKKKEGATDFQALYDKEALVILYVVPQNLDLRIEGSAITKTINEDGRYKIYTKPDVQKIILKAKNYDDTPIDFDDLGSKDIRYYRIEIPQSNVDVESFDPNTKVGNYLIETTPAGALIQMAGNPPFNERNYKTPFTIEGFKSGTEIITLALNRYEPIKDTILISSSKGKKSKYNLIPKFAFINCNIEPAIPVSKILMDGKELSSIVNGQNYECQKGTHNIEINAPHFYSETRQISLAAGATNELNIKLKPKIGMLSIVPDENASGAEVFVNENSIGKLPISNYRLMEGNYFVRYSKKGFVTEVEKFEVSINENATTNIKKVKMINVKEIRINTMPVENATVYVDGKDIGNTPVSIKLGVGIHKILIQKKNFHDLSENIDLQTDQQKFSFTLSPIFNYDLDTRPSKAEIFIDNVSQGTTPAKISVETGKHLLTFKKYGYINRKKDLNVDNVPHKLSSTLRLDSYLGLGYVIGGAGIGMGGELIYMSKRGGILLALHECIALAAIPFDYKPFGGSVQYGYRIHFPVEFFLHAGVGLRQFANKIKASDGTTEVKNYWSPVGGITLPIHLSTKFGFYLKADYWAMSEQAGFASFSGGILF